MKTKIIIIAACILGCILASTYVATPSYNYKQQWSKVDSLEKKGLPKSALEVVEKIYTKAKEEGNKPQFIKAVLYKIKLQTDYQEDYYKKIFNDLNTEIAGASTPEKQILHSITADIYWTYYQYNRYKFLERTETVNFNKDDIETWTLRDIVDKVTYHYRQSLSKSDELKKINLKDYDDILIAKKNSKKYRPTLYDFLAHRAVDFFMNEESGVTMPAYSFELNNPDYFKPAGEFAAINITTKDTSSLKYNAIKILQDLVAFHNYNDLIPSNALDLSSYIDVDLKRLKLVWANSVIENKDSLYLNALEELEKKCSDNPASADVSYEIAVEYNIRGAKYNPSESDKYKWDIKKASEICKKTIEKFPDTDGGKNCKCMLQGIINQASLSVTTESINLPDKPFRASVSYKSTPEVFARVVQIDFKENSRLTRKYYDKQLVSKYVAKPVFKQWSVKLPDDGDYQTHTAEIKMPELPLGYYIVLISSDKNFSCINNVVAYSSFWVSNISYISKNKNYDYSKGSYNGTYDFYVLDRETGLPLNGAQVKTFCQQYNYKTRDYEEVNWKNFTTDENGFFSVPPLIDNSSKYFYAEITYKNDKLITESNFSMYDYSNSEQSKTLTYFFTDRAIYRPGQTVYFKGIVLEKYRNKSSIKTGFKTTVVFYDVNRQKISELTLTTNEYGTFSGTFTAPVNVLNGQMSINNVYGNVYFSVEEYKRPKFEVTFDPVKGSYKLGQNVTVKGRAKAYAGNMITDAQVKYRVVRTATFPFWRWWWGYYPSSPEMEITNGTTVTDENGMFCIDFTAIPDLSLSKKYSPVFSYVVYADVTDLNGETHTDSKRVYVGYKALLASVDIPEKLDREKVDTFRIYTTNLNGETEYAKGTIKIYSLKQPDKIFRERKWDRPDKFVMSKEEYYQSFPYDIYDDETNSSKWEKDKLVLSTAFDTEKDSILRIKNLREWQQGQYVVEISTKDKYGENISVSDYFTLFSVKEKQSPVNDVVWFRMLKDEGEPGEKVSFVVGTKDKDVNILYEIESRDSADRKQWIKLSQEQRVIEIPIKEEYRGNFSVCITAVKHGRSYSFKNNIYVPYSNKDLDIEFETFRNKLQPGQNEEWKIKIKGSKGEKVAAEMLATLYDASLDAFRANSWYFNIYDSYYSYYNWEINNAFSVRNSQLCADYRNSFPGVYKEYDVLNWFGFYYGGYYGRSGYYIDGVRCSGAGYDNKKTMVMAYKVPLIDKDTEAAEAAPGDVMDESVQLSQNNIATASEATGHGNYSWGGEDGKTSPKGIDTRNVDFSDVKLRQNFNETAFFFPHLETNEDGDVVIKFTAPESLTKWKMLGFAHTKDLMYGFTQNELVTQKDLMVVPNAPRFFREGDNISFSAKVSNISDKSLKGEAKINFFNAVTMEPVDNLVGNNNPVVSFSVEKGQNAALSWDIKIPEGIGAITYRIYAKSGNFSDGEEMTIPVLTNRMLVTESMPLPINGNQTKKFSFDKLINSGSSTTLRSQKLTLEFTSNPAWYAIQALPYIIEYPYECSEQVFSRYYGNSIASHIVNSSPKIKQVFDSWKNLTPDALLSNLEKNQELKSLMLEETPWVLDAKNESERKRRVALLFDLNKMSNELGSALKKLKKMQTPNGGWAWFEGMRDSRYITQHIVTGFGHLDKLGVKNVRENQEVWTMVKNGVLYLDNRIREDYEYIKKYYPQTMNENHLGWDDIQYLYARSYFNDIKIASNNQEAVNYFKGQAKKYWLSQNKYMQGMIALGLYRYGDKVTPAAIIKSLKENALHSEEMGMYWRDFVASYYWYEAPIESQALLIEAFDEVANDQQSVEEMKIWLLKQKQTQDWKTTKATVEACYALLLRGTDVLASDKLVEVSLGDIKIDPKKLDGVQVEAGTGYYKTSWSGSDIKPEMGNITVTKTDDGVAWGALYWQYFEQLDKITPHETPLKLEKKLFREINTDKGPVIEPVTENTVLKVGDKIKVRIELRVDRNMEYVQMKDMRASGFEPVNVISQYKYQDGLGYYESTRDAATNFFFDYLPKGTYVFEYPLYVTHKGNFSNGITTIQCMYAPEFSAHSEGIRVEVK